ncbi:MAG: fasciclin domain-containing protein [Acidobacteriota bacterium]|nr:fasciclin domain-containing protein [Acidobacteriota bacterium]
MVDYLKGAGPFTVFLPTDEAFDALPAGSLLELERPENHDRLKKLLQYHIVEGSHPSSEVKTMQTMLTTSGDKLAVESDGTGIRINNARVMGSDVLCANGIIHVVDAVLLGY